MSIPLRSIEPQRSAPQKQLKLVPQLGAPAAATHSSTDPLVPLVRSLAIAVFEVIEGTRRAATLSRVLSFGALRDIGTLANLRRDQLTVLKMRPRQVHGAGRVRIDRSHPDTAEVATVVEVGSRARAVAMRLEWSHGRWRVSDLAVL